MIQMYGWSTRQVESCKETCFNFIKIVCIKLLRLYIKKGHEIHAAIAVRSKKFYSNVCNACFRAKRQKRKRATVFWLLF